LEEAANAYREVVASFPEDSVVDQARLGLARLAEAKNDAKEALRRYDEVMAAKSSGMRAAEARRQREALLRQHPELTPAPTPMPAATITNTITVTPASSPASASPPSTAGGKPPGS
jgi:2-oxo-4-hydroxy-4-carboxy--5-ureidoimidazoline (OHCU) decarboxylase